SGQGGRDEGDARPLAEDLGAEERPLRDHGVRGRLLMRRSEILGLSRSRPEEQLLEAAAHRGGGLPGLHRREARAGVGVVEVLGVDERQPFGPGAPRDIGVLAAGAEAHPVPPRHQSPRQARHGVDVPRERGGGDDEFGHEHSSAGHLLTCSTTLAPCADPRWTPGCTQPISQAGDVAGREAPPQEGPYILAKPRTAHSVGRPRTPHTRRSSHPPSHPGRDAGGFLSGIVADPRGAPRHVPDAPTAPALPRAGPAPLRTPDRPLTEAALLPMPVVLTRGAPWRVILLFAVPLLLGNIVQQLYQFADAAVIGRHLGVDSLASVGATGGLLFLLLGFAIGVTTGFAVPTAQAFGAGDARGVSRSVATGTILTAVISVIISVGGALAAGPMLSVLRTPAELLPEATLFARVSFLGAGAVMFFNYLAAIIRAIGDSRTPLRYLVIACVLNVVLVVGLVIGAGLGIAGAALATCLAQLASALACLVHVLAKVPTLHVVREDWRVDRASLA